jgi:hypothetical protein
MPVDKYSMGDGYYEEIYPSDSSFLQEGTSAPVTRTFAIERLVANSNSYIRVAVVPCLRIVNSTITVRGSAKNYVKLYVPLLVAGEMPRRSLSITLTGTDLNVSQIDNVNTLRIEVVFLRENEGFDNGFFRFSAPVETPNIPADSMLQVYCSNVQVSLGLHS